MVQKLKIKTITPLYPIDKDGTINPNADAMNLDWLGSARLLERAKAGDKKAAAQLEALSKEQVFEIDFEIV